MMRRNTPCVLGCCGPMLSVISLGESDSRISIATPSDTAEPLLAAGRRILALGAVLQMLDQDVLVVERPVFAERVTREAIFQQDAAQVRVPDELDAEQIVDLALLKLGAGPDGGQAGAERIRLRREVGADHHAAGRRHVVPAVAVVEHLDAVSPIDGGNRREVVVAEPLHLPRDWHKLIFGDSDFEVAVAALPGQVWHQLAKLGHLFGVRLRRLRGGGRGGGPAAGCSRWPGTGSSGGTGGRCRLRGPISSSGGWCGSRLWLGRRGRGLRLLLR